MHVFATVYDIKVNESRTEIISPLTQPKAAPRYFFFLKCVTATTNITNKKQCRRKT